MLGYALALVIGLALGLLGGGGAILTVPALVYAMGVSVKQAVPTSLVVVGLTSLVGATRHARAGTLNLRAALAFGPPAMLGALAGSRAALRVSGDAQLLVFGVILLAAAGMMLRPVRGHGEASHPRSPLPIIGVLGAGVGFLTGFICVGGGFMYVPALVLLGGLEMKQAVGTSLALIALSSATGVASYLGRVPIDWAMVVPFTALAFVGVAIGSALVPKVPQPALRRGFAVFMILMGLMVLLRR